MTAVTINNLDAPGIDTMASSVQRYFAQYPHIVELHWREEYNVNIETLSETIFKWCSNVCIGEVAAEILRVCNGPGDDILFNELSGADRWFWAFTDEQDAMMFALRW